MTVSSNDRRKSYAGNGVTTIFNGPMAYSADVISTSLSDDVTGDITSAGPFTVTQLGKEAGTIVTLSVAPPSGKTLTILRTVPYAQTVDVTNQGAFNARVIETGFDLPVMQIQQIADRQNRSLYVADNVPGDISLVIDGIDPLKPLVGAADGLGFEFGDTELTGDMLLRPNLADSSDPSKGASLVAFKQQGLGAVARSAREKIGSTFTVNDFGATPNGTSDSMAPLLSAKVEIGTGIATFEQNKGQPSVYKFNTLGSTDFNGLILDVPQGMTLSLPTSAYAPLKGVRFTRQTRLFFDDIDVDYFPVPHTAEQRNKSGRLTAGDLRQQKLSTVAPNTALRFLSLPINVSDTFSNTSPTFSDGTSYSYNAVATGSWYGGFIALRRGETYSCVVNKTGNGALGVMFRHNGGYSVLYADPTAPSTALMWRGIKATGGAIATAQDTSFPGRGSYTSYDPSRALWGVTILDNGQALVTLNGRAITAPVWTTALGDIYEVGFVWQPTAGGASASFTDTMIERNSDPLGRVELPEIRIFGDSTSEYLTGMWQDDFKDILDHTFGVKLTSISNFAVSGTNSFDVLTSIGVNGLGGAYYVVVGIGTNDIQSSAPLATTASNISAIISAIQGAGRVPVIVLPYMWYGQAQVGVRGQNSTNYDGGAPYRARIARLCSDTGAVLVDPTRELAEPKPAFITSQTAEDPLVRDNIHQSYLGYKLYAWAIARAIASRHLAKPAFKDYRAAVPSDWLRNGWTAGTNLKVCITEDGFVSLQGNMGAGTAANGTVILNLPRWARPEVQQSFISWTNAGLGEVRIGTNGDVTIDNVGSAFNTVHLNNARFYAAGS